MSASHVGREQTIEVNGKKYRFGRLKREDWAEFHQWAEKLLPPLLDILAASIEKFPLEIQRLMASESVAMVNEPIERRTSSLIDTPSGWAKLVELLLRENHPDITDEEAWDVSIEIKGQMWDIIAKAEGKIEGKEQGKEQEPVAGEK